MSVLLNVFEAPARNFKVWKLPIAGDLKVVFQKIREFSQKRVADCAFSNGFLYFKGDPDIVERELVRGQIIVGNPLEEITLASQREGPLLPLVKEREPFHKSVQMT
jgi:hypothetical protein